MSYSAWIAQTARKEFIIRAGQDRAKGASRAWALRKHVIRNAILPTLTMAGILLGQLLAGAVVTETVFGLRGSAADAQAVSAQDARCSRPSSWCRRQRSW